MIKDKELVVEVVKEVLIQNDEVLLQYVKMLMERVNANTNQEPKRPVGFRVN